VSAFDDVRVSTIELFFDLVFVFAITQLTGLLAADPTVRGVVRVGLVFGNLWWMYGGYARLTNAVPPRQPVLRLLLLVGMVGFLIVALAIPEAFGDSGVVLGLGHLLVTLVLGLALAAALGWLYFDGEDERAERALASAEGNRVPWLALYGFGHAFLLVLGGVIVLAAGLKRAIGHYGQPVADPTAWFLAVGVAAYVGGLALFRQILGTGPIGLSLVIAVLALPTWILSIAVSAEAQLGALAAIVAGGAIAGSRRTSPSDADPGPPTDQGGWDPAYATDDEP
jgi:low temperature requirement protein LtrA